MFRNSSIALALLITCVQGAFVNAQIERNQIPDDVKSMLEKADQFELLSLNGERDKSKDAFRGWKVLGKTAVKDAKVRAEVIAAFKKGVAENKSGPAFCFIPRHGIRVVQGGKTADLVVCFECSRVEAYVGAELVANIWITGSPQTVFDRALKTAGIPTPKKR